ncbi:MULTISPECIES: MFS transporter [unclassified Oceanispirochaeta]|uniref:MFS transporter n=1 Tax=unclassified Oceanispirochaeta TaxID=2635722 RepID=UPI000E097879|nr:MULTISPECIES: MFS transporter [unclassified Oceanispirochaeta]MBF9017887.1 MFS transporter [Oceanispirochaeta sp. M2]NPD74398.1 MFS transporter [Oceanispirochaeta sp. M1]RDG29783.1 MFS transporter [Oceanispirochaeta sp. M1]
MSQTIEKLPTWKMIMFGMGQMGWSLGGFSVGALINYFYMPPETGGDVFPALINQGAVILFLTVIGLSNFAGRIFDAVTDPLIANMSDRSRFKFGRRRTFMAIAILPLSFLSYLVFTPPVPHESALNSVWVFTVIILFYLFMTMYVIPYGALIPEIGHTSKERMLLSTITSVAWAMGFFIGNSVYVLKGVFEGMGYSPVTSFRIVVAMFSVIGFIAMLMPIIFIDEDRYCRKNRSNDGAVKALLTSLQNIDFRSLLGCQFFYQLGNVFLEIGIIYYVTILMKLPEEQAFTLMAAMFILSFAYYPMVVKTTGRIGKKKLLNFGFAVHALVFALIPFSGLVPGVSSAVWGWTIILLESIPVAIFGIVPTALLADIAKSDGNRTGSHNEAIFFGANSFAIKLAMSVTNLIFPSILLLGRSIDNPLGVRLTAVIAFVFTLLGYFAFRGYQQDRVDQYLDEELLPALVTV